MKNLLPTIKRVLLLLLPVLLHVKFTVAAGGVPTLSFPDFSSVFPSVGSFAATAVYWLEILLRIIPTAQNLSLVSLVHELLAAFVPNSAVSAAGEVGEHVHQWESIFPGAGGTSQAAA